MSETYFFRALGVLALVLSLGVWPCARGQDAATTGGATDAVATVLAVRGNVVAIDANGKSRELALKSALFRRDTIKSGDRGRIQISFLDETLISLGCNTEMTIERFDYRPNQNDGELVTQVRDGAFRVMGGAIAKIAPSKFKTETPTATIGIRGSFYAGNVAALQLTAVFLGGRGITIVNAAGFVEITRPSFGTTVAAPNAPPEPPRRFSAAEIGQLLTSFAFSGLGGDAVPAATGTPGTGPGAASQDAGDTSLGTGAGTESGGGGTGSGGGNTDTGTGTGLAPDTGGSGGGNPAGNVPSNSGLLPNPQTYNELQTEPPEVLPPPSPNPPQPPVPGSQSMSGRFLNLYSGITRTVLVEAHRGTVTGTAVNGTVANGRAQATDGSAFGFDFRLGIVPPQPGGAYDPAGAGSTFNATGHAVALTGPATVTFNAPFEYTYDNLGEFVAFHTQTPLSLATGSYSEAGYLGAPSLTLPAGAIARYEGLGLAALQPATGATPAFIGQAAFAAVNFRNGSAMGGFCQPSATGGSSAQTPAYGTQNLFFLGKVNGLGLTDTHLFGTGNAGGPILFQGALDGASFYGSAHQGLGIAGTGSLFDLGTGLQTGTFDLTAATMKQEETVLIPTYASTWNGFAVGAATPVTGAPGLYGNTAPSGVTLNLDRAAGAVTGALNLSSGANTLSATVGDSASAYVDDHRLIATLTDAGVGPGRSSVDTTKPGSSFLVTDPAAGNRSEWYSWGYWSFTHEDAALAANSFHIPLLSGLWVAGEPTEPRYVKGLMNTPNAVGVYSGDARCLEARGTQVNTLLGTSNLNVFFSTHDVQGRFAFPTVSMQAKGTLQPDGSGFSGAVTAVDRPAAPAALTSGSTFQGGFLGPQANAVAGSLGATLSDGSTYKAVFAGNRQ